MNKKKKQFFQDITLLIISVCFAVFIVRTGIAHEFILSLGSLRWLGVFLAGAFFTSMFTTAPSIVLLSELAQTTSLPALAILGGIGAVLGDYLIFYFVRDRIFDDFKYLLSFSKQDRFSVIHKTNLFKFFIPFLGALIISYPFPDEIGIVMLGISKVSGKIFFFISFISNGIGIFIIGWMAKVITNL